MNIFYIASGEGLSPKQTLSDLHHDVITKLKLGYTLVGGSSICATGSGYIAIQSMLAPNHQNSESSTTTEYVQGYLLENS